MKINESKIRKSTVFFVVICFAVFIFVEFNQVRNGADKLNDGRSDEFRYEVVESGGRALTEAEKNQMYEERLIERLQATIEKFENINKAIINIDSPNEAEKTVNVLIITESDERLSDEEKTGITNIIKDSISKDLTVTVNLNEE